MEKNRDMVVSTRVRLARSIDGLVFPIKMTSQQQNQLAERIESRINSNNDFIVHKMKDMDYAQRQVLLEQHAASAALIQKPEAVLLQNKNKDISILIGEEDHLRIQSILSGLNLEKADELTKAVDSIVSAEGYAFDEQLGYLTACPTNTGTGMRASVMLHIPALYATGQLRNISEHVSKFGYTLRGYYGEGSNAEGNMFQLSNQVTLGVSEEEIISGLHQVMSAVINKERDVRDMLLKNNKNSILDRLYRSLGVLKYARMVTSEEMMQRMSDIRLGMGLGLFKNIEFDEIEKATADLQPASILSICKTEEDQANRDKIRADKLRKIFEKC